MRGICLNAQSETLFHLDRRKLSLRILLCTNYARMAAKKRIETPHKENKKGFTVHALNWER